MNTIDNILNDFNSIFYFNNKYSVLKGILYYFKFSIEKQEFKSQIILIHSFNLLTLLKSLATNHYFIAVLQDSNLYIVLLEVISLMIKNDIEISLLDGLNEVHEIINQGLFQNEKVTDNESIMSTIKEFEKYLRKNENDPRLDNTLYQLELIELKLKVNDKQLNYYHHAEKILKGPEEIENNLSEFLSVIYNCEKECKELINNIKNIIETANKLEDGVKGQYNNIVSHDIESTIDKEVWKQVQEALRYTVTDGSPQYPMHNKLVQIACKTGTAEVDGYKDSWHSWLVAYAPYDAPPEDRICVATIVEACNKWEWWAPYATNIIIQGIFANQTYDEAVKELGFTYLTKNRGRQE